MGAVGALKDCRSSGRFGQKKKVSKKLGLGKHDTNPNQSRGQWTARTDLSHRKGVREPQKECKVFRMLGGNKKGDARPEHYRAERVFKAKGKNIKVQELGAES